MQQKTSRAVQFEITESTREAVAAWIKEAGLRSEDYLLPSRLHESLHLSTRQYAHIVDSWVEEIGLDPASSSVSFFTHGCGVRLIGGNSRPRTPFGRVREPRSALTQETRILKDEALSRLTY